MNIDIKVGNPVYQYDTKQWEVDLNYDSTYTGVSGTGKTREIAMKDAIDKISKAIRVVEHVRL